MERRRGKERVREGVRGKGDEHRKQGRDIRLKQTVVYFIAAETSSLKTHNLFVVIQFSRSLQ